MGYGVQLLRQAVEVAGSRYKLAALADLREGHLSEAWHGKRRVPESWVFNLAEVVGVDPAEAIRQYRADKRAGKCERSDAP